MKETILAIGAYPPPFGGAELNQKILVEALASFGYEMTVLPIVAERHPARDSDLNPHILPAVVTPYPMLANLLRRNGRELDVLERRSLRDSNGNPAEVIAGIVMLVHQQRVRWEVGRHPAGLNIVSPLWHTRELLPDGTPVLGIAQGNDVNSLKPTDTYAISAINRCDHLICISPSLAKKLHDLGVDKPMSVVLPALDPAFLRPLLTTEERQNLREQYGIGPDDFVFFHVSADHLPVKNIADIIHGFSKAHAVFPNSKLVVAGEGKDTPGYKKMAEQMGLTGQVIFLGKIDNSDLPKFYDLSDCFVLASSSEGLARVLLEAQARLRPAIISRIPGPTDIIIDGQNGLTFAVGAVDDLADKMVHFMTDGQLRRRLVDNTSAFRSNLLPFDQWVKTHDRIIQKLIHHNQTR